MSPTVSPKRQSLDSSETNLVTTYTFNGKEFLVKMVAADHSLEIVVTDKCSGEEWEGALDKTYVENITHKTGNFKKFTVFVCMLKSGLLKTSDCVTLDFFTYEDLQHFQADCLRAHTSRCFRNHKHNERRYLIVNYSVEFDRIHYPLPLEYCGPPDPVILQHTVLRLQKELEKAKEEVRSTETCKDVRRAERLQQRVDQLSSENVILREEIRSLKMKKSSPKTNQQVQTLQKAIWNLEKSVLSERRSHHQLVEKLKKEKLALLRELQDTKKAEQRLRNQLNKLMEEAAVKKRAVNMCNKPSTGLNTIYRNSKADPRLRRSRSTPTKIQEQENKRSRSSSAASKLSSSSINEINTALNSTYKNHRRKKTSVSHSRSSSVTSTGSKSLNRTKELDFDELQLKIESLQKLLEMHS